VRAEAKKAATPARGSADRASAADWVAEMDDEAKGPGRTRARP
jgi:hypothetical protein